MDKDVGLLRFLASASRTKQGW